MKESTISIMLVDDHQMFIDGIKALLRNETGIHIIAEANNGEDALRHLEQNKIDLIITDVSMPGMSGTQLAARIKHLYPDSKVLVLTMYNELHILEEILEAEAEGYILKNTSKKELLEAIQQIMDGGTFFSDSVLGINQLLKSCYTEKENTTQKTLTDREVEVLQMICNELSSKQIAKKLFLSVRTIETHRKNMIRKTGSKSLVALIKYAYRNGIVAF